MPPTRSALRIAAIGALSVVLLAGTTVAVSTWIRRSGPPVRVRSDEAGVSLAVPRGWTVAQNHPTQSDHEEFLKGHENAAFGFLQRGGFWIARWPASETTTLATLKTRHERAQAKSPRRGWSLREEPIAGFDAIVQRYSTAPGVMQRLRLGDKRVAIREFIAEGFVFRVGTWTLPHAGKVTGQLDTIVDSLDVFRPRPWSASFGRDARLRLPGGWVERHADAPGAVFTANSPSDPVQAWVYVFHFRDASVAEAVATASQNIAGNKGTVDAQSDTTLDGRRAVRLDFVFPDSTLPNARHVEWFAADGHGGTYVLAVTRRRADVSVGDDIPAGWRWSRPSRAT